MEQMYIAVPMFETDAQKVEKVLRQWLDENKGEKYNKMPNGKEKEELGSMIHGVAGVVSRFSDKNYKKPWPEFEKFFYPNKK